MLSTKWFAMGTLMLSLSTSAFAAKKYGMAGCGLGSLVIDPSGSQTSAATTNGTAFNQLFGISSGTSNCQNAEATAAEQRQETFMVTNYESLSKEIAQGHGETLIAFSETLGCSEDAYPAVASQLQRQYNTIFKAPGAMAALDASKASLKGVSDVASHCRYLD